MKTYEVKLIESTYEYGAHWRLFHAVDGAKVLAVIQCQGAEVNTAFRTSAALGVFQMRDLHEACDVAQSAAAALELKLHALRDGFVLAQTLQSVLR